MIEYLTRLSTKADKLMLFGGLNYPSINWLAPNNTPLDDINDAIQAFVDESFLSQLVNVPTRGNNVLDLVLFSKPKCLASLDALPPLANCDHCIIITRPQVILKSRMIENHTTRRERKKLNVNLACILLRATNWKNVFINCNYIGDFVNCFISIFNEVLYLSCPLRLVRRNGPSHHFPCFI